MNSMTLNKDQGEFQMSRFPTEQVVDEDKTNND